MTSPAMAAPMLRSRLKMRHLQLIAVLDAERSIHKAAARLNTTQPAATKLLADVERLLGVRLFERTTRGILPTPHGESLVRHARAILGTLEHAGAELDAITAGATGKLTVGVLLVVAPVLLPRALLLFKRRNPRVTVQVQEGTLGTLLPMLHRGELDVVVGRLTADLDSSGLVFEHCYDEPMAVVVRRGHPLCGKKELHLADLASETWILPTPEAAYRHRIDAAFRQDGCEPPAKLIESMSMLTNTALLRESNMLGVLPRNVAVHYADAGVLALLAVPLPVPSGPVGIITRSTGASTPASADLLAALRATGRALAGTRATRKGPPV